MDNTGASMAHPTQENEIFYRAGVVTFIDVLGFRSIVSSRSAAEVDSILKAAEAVNPNFHIDIWAKIKGREPLKRITEEYSYKFSDTVVHAYIGNHEDNLVQFCQKLKSIIFNVGRFQYFAALQGVFVRGGIAYGDIYCEDNVIFGPALIKAYDIESQKALMPTVVLDEELVELFNTKEVAYARLEDPDVDEQHLKFHTGFLDRFGFKMGGNTIVDYLELGYLEELGMDFDYHLQKHKQSIEKAYAEGKDYKFRLLAEYHNKKVRKDFADSLIDLP